MRLLTEQELLDVFDSIPDEEYDGFLSYGRAIEAKVIEKIKALGWQLTQLSIITMWFDGDGAERRAVRRAQRVRASAGLGVIGAFYHLFIK